MAKNVKNSNKTGIFWGLSYDWRKPTWKRTKARVWNPEEPRFVTPRAFGWGYSFNFYRIFHRVKRP